VFYFLIALKSFDVLLGVFYNILDARKFGGVLRMPEKERIRRTEDGSLQGDNSLLKPYRQLTLVGLALLFSLVVTAWTIYFVYLI
jgi:hypothetical protein